MYMEKTQKIEINYAAFKNQKIICKESYLSVIVGNHTVRYLRSFFCLFSRPCQMLWGRGCYINFVGS